MLQGARALLLTGLVWVFLGAISPIQGLPRLALFVLWIDLLLFGFILVRVFDLGKDSRERRKRLRYTLLDLDALSGAEFEAWVETILAAAKIPVTRTGRSKDYGVDLIAEIYGIRIAIEVKRRRAKVGNDVVRSILAGARYHGGDAAAVVTQAAITREAVQQATRGDLPILLLGRERLDQLAGDLILFAREIRAQRRAEQQAGPRSFLFWQKKSGGRPRP